MNSIEYQATIFVDKIESTELNKLLSEISDNLAPEGVSFESIQINPDEITKAIQPEFREVQLAAAINSNGFNVVVNRVASGTKIGIVHSEVDDVTFPSKADFLKKVKAILSVNTIKKHPVKRCGFISTYLLPVQDERGFVEYANKILAKDWESNVSAVSMQLLYKVTVDDKALNLNLVIQSVQRLDSGKKSMKVQTDINTLEDTDLSASDSKPYEVIESLSAESITAPYVDLLTK